LQLLDGVDVVRMQAFQVGFFPRIKPTLVNRTGIVGGLVN
jgi:hypothetical protein